VLKKISWMVNGDCWECISHKSDGKGYPSGSRKYGRRSIARVMYEEKI